MDHHDLSRSSNEKENVPDVLNQLERYGNLTMEYNRFLSLLENADQLRQSVRENIFQKVKQEYEIKKATLEQDRKKLEALLQENLDRFLEDQDRTRKTSQEETDRLEEIDFRVRVGEFSEEEQSEERDALKQNLIKKTEDLARIEEILQQYSHAGFSPASDHAFEPLNEIVRESSDAPHNPELQVAPFSDVQARALPETGEKGSCEEEEKGPVGQTDEVSLEKASEDFLVLEEQPDLSDDGCPVIHCPETLSETPSHFEPALEQASTNGFVTGYLVAMEGSRMGDRFPLISSNITLGNSPGIDIRLEDTGISNFHARILYKDRKHFLENLDPMGRSFVNGIQADLIELKDGDVIRLGETKFQVEYASTEPAEKNN